MTITTPIHLTPFRIMTILRNFEESLNTTFTIRRIFYVVGGIMFKIFSPDLRKELRKEIRTAI